MVIVHVIRTSIQNVLLRACAPPGSAHVASGSTGLEAMFSDSRSTANMPRIAATAAIAVDDMYGLVGHSHQKA